MAYKVVSLRGLVVTPDLKASIRILERMLCIRRSFQDRKERVYRQASSDVQTHKDTDSRAQRRIAITGLDMT